MLELRCPIRRLAAPPVLQLARSMALLEVPHRIVALPPSADATASARPDVAHGDHPERYLAADWAVSVGVGVVDNDAAIKVCESTWPRGEVLCGALEAARFMATTPPVGVMDPAVLAACGGNAFEVAAAFREAQFVALGIDGLFAALMGESAEQLSFAHAALADRVAFINDAAERDGPFGLRADGSLRRALLAPQLRYLVHECGMPASPYPALQAVLGAPEGHAALAAADARIARYKSEFIGGDGPEAAALDIFAEGADGASPAALMHRREGGESLFGMVHKLLRARLASPNRDARRSAPVGSAEVADPLRGRPRQSGNFGHQGSRGGAGVPWNVAST